MPFRSKPFQIAALLCLAASAPAAADSITISGPSPAGSCTPFGCGGPQMAPATIYQQLFASTFFTHVFEIRGLELFNTGVNSGGDQYLDPAHYEIWLSTTPAAVDGLDAVDFTANRGTDATRIFAGPLGGDPNGEVPPGPDTTLPFTWTSAFRYDPRAGNLLMEVRKTGGSFFGDDGTYLDFVFLPGLSVVSDFSGFSPYWNNRSAGLAARFSGRFGDPVGGAEPVPEPGTLILLGSGLAVAVRRATRR